MDWYPRHHRDRKDQVGAIVSFVTDHPHSYASLAVCRRALDSGIERISGAVINELEHYLSAAPEDEIDAYYSIIR